MRTKLAVTVLGSGGPISNKRRASAGYLISIDERPRILLDAGGGVFERIGQGGIDPSGLEQILLTHMHIDHSSDLAAVVMDLYMRDRSRPISVAGPAGRRGTGDAREVTATQPGAHEFIALLFGNEGAWRYMNTFDGFATDVFESPSDVADSSISAIPVNAALRELGVAISAAAVPHGMMPSVAFRIDCDGRSIVFSGDVSGMSESLVALAEHCSLLVHDFALPERNVPHGNLHAKPSVVGETAHTCGAQRLLLSHFMPAIESELAESVAIARRAYGGHIDVAEDLKTYEVP